MLRRLVARARSPYRARNRPSRICWTCGSLVIRTQYFCPRIWQLRHNLSAYDAAYVVLAEKLGATLLTRDARLASAAGHAATIEVV